MCAPVKMCGKFVGMLACFGTAAIVCLCVDDYQ